MVRNDGKFIRNNPSLKIYFCRMPSCLIRQLIPLVLLTLLTMPKGHGQNSLNITDNRAAWSVDEYLYLYVDSTRQKTIEDVLQLDFVTNPNKTYNQGYNTEADWIRFSVTNSTQHGIDRLLMINKLLMDSVQLYFKNDGRWQEMLGGEHDPEMQKTYAGANIYFPIHLSINDTAVFYLRVTGPYGKQFSLSIIDEEERKYLDAAERSIQGIYIGALLIITLYNLFLGFSVKDSLYFHYALSNVATLCAVLALRGAFISILGSDFNHLVPVLTSCFIGFWGAVVTNFSVRILDLKKYSRISFYLLLIVSILAVTSTIAVNVMIANGSQITYRLVPASSVIISFISIIAGAIALRKGSHYARFFLLAWTGMLVSSSLYALVVTGVIELNPFTSNFYVFGSLLEVLLLSFALADRYNFILNERARLKEELHHKEGDLAMVISDNRMRHQYRTKLLQEVEEVSKADSESLRAKLNSLIRELRMQNDTEKKFDFMQENIATVNQAFDQKLKDAYPRLSASERELCHLIKLNLSVKDIARLRNTTEGAIKTARYRIKDKMNLKSLAELDDIFQKDQL